MYMVPGYNQMADLHQGRAHIVGAQLWPHKLALSEGALICTWYSAVGIRATYVEEHGPRSFTESNNRFELASLFSSLWVQKDYLGHEWSVSGLQTDQALS